MSDLGLHVSDQTILEAIGGAITGVFSWVLGLTRFTSRTAARQADHEKLCTERQSALKEDLKEIKGMLEKQDERSYAHREEVSRQLSSIKTKVAVLQTQYGDPPTGDTGRFKT